MVRPSKKKTQAPNVYKSGPFPRRFQEVFVRSRPRGQKKCDQPKRFSGRTPEGAGLCDGAVSIHQSGKLIAYLFEGEDDDEGRGRLFTELWINPVQRLGDSVASGQIGHEAAMPPDGFFNLFHAV
jgi:hypothetical protein